MADYFVGHHPTMPGSGKTAQAVNAARCLHDCAHASMMTSVPRLGKTTAAASSTGLRSCYAPSGDWLFSRRRREPCPTPVPWLTPLTLPIRRKYLLSAVTTELPSPVVPCAEMLV
jgi:hypothetical protein